MLPSIHPAGFPETKYRDESCLFFSVCFRCQSKKRINRDPPLLPFASSVAPGVIQNQTQIPPCVVYRCDSSGKKCRGPGMWVVTVSPAPAWHFKNLLICLRQASVGDEAAFIFTPFTFVRGRRFPLSAPLASRRHLSSQLVPSCPFILNRPFSRPASASVRVL